MVENNLVLNLIPPHNCVLVVPLLKSEETTDSIRPFVSSNSSVFFSSFSMKRNHKKNNNNTIGVKSKSDTPSPSSTNNSNNLSGFLLWKWISNVNRSIDSNKNNENQEYPPSKENNDKTHTDHKNDKNDIIVNKYHDIHIHQSSRRMLKSDEYVKEKKINCPDYVFHENSNLIAYLPDKLSEILKEAIYQFNIKPEKSKDFLILQKVISDSPIDFADFIYNNSVINSKLNKTKIGEFFGKFSSFHQKVLQLFLGKFNFTGLTLDQAIRLMVCNFFLAGEAQQIDRILLLFAEVYYSQNSDREDLNSSEEIMNADIAYILSFSIFMLNTDLHNPNIPLKDKMTLKQFIKNNRGINNGNDIPTKQLETIYSNIRFNEIKVDDVEYESEITTFQSPTIAGYLYKLNHGNSVVPTWKKRWFILNDGCLYYFNKPYEKRPKCIMPLENIQIEIFSDINDHNDHINSHKYSPGYNDDDNSSFGSEYGGNSPRRGRADSRVSGRTNSPRSPRREDNNSPGGGQNSRKHGNSESGKYSPKRITTGSSGNGSVDYSYQGNVVLLYM